MKAKNWTIWAAVLAMTTVGVGLIASPASAAGPSVASIYTSKNPASAGEGVTLTVVVTGTFQSPIGFVQLFDALSPLGPPLALSPDFDTFLGCTCVPTDHSTASLTRSFSRGTHLLTVDYTGDGPLGNLPIFGGGLVSLVINAAQSTTSVSSSMSPSVFGQGITFTASASSSGSPASGSIQFRADGAPLGTPQTVDASGHASMDTSTLAVGNHPVTASFTSDNPSVLNSSDSLAGGQLVNPADTTTAVSSVPNPSEFGGGVNVTATTTVNAPGAGTPTGTVQFRDNGIDVGLPQNVGSGGRAAITTAGFSVGSHVVSAVYTSGSSNFNSSSGSATQIVSRAHTTLAYDGATSGDFNDPTTLSARLTRTADSLPLAGQTVTFTMGSEGCSQLTDASGAASCTITPSEAAGPQVVMTVFTGDDNYLASSDNPSFAVTKEETTTTYTGPTVIAQGNPVVLSGRLLEDGTTPIQGRTLTLTLGSGGIGSQTCATGPTDIAGNARCTVASVSVTQGSQPVKADFAGNGYYLPSSDSSKSVIIFAFPSSGIFVLGDRTSSAAGSSPVMFWGSQWAKQNTLSGGGAPSAFKGFADTTSSRPPACGGTWTTAPGNSSAPVDPLPAYMGTAVTTAITKNGSTIAGNITRIVVVVTAPGYESNPGHPGTGVIIATYC